MILIAVTVQALSPTSLTPYHIDSEILNAAPFAEMMGANYCKQQRTTIALSSLTFPFSGRRKVIKGTFINSNFVQLRVEGTQKLFAKPVPTPPANLRFLPSKKPTSRAPKYFRDPSGSV